MTATTDPVDLLREANQVLAYHKLTPIEIVAPLIRVLDSVSRSIQLGLWHHPATEVLEHYEPELDLARAIVEAGHAWDGAR